MNDLTTKWVEALRSGKYNQGQYHLRRNDAFCCLGVLCDLSGLGKWEKDPTVTFDRYMFVTEKGSFVKTIPDFVMNAAGFDSYVTLVRMNDDMDKSFLEIADWIEKNF